MGSVYAFLSNHNNPNGTTSFNNALLLDKASTKIFHCLDADSNTTLTEAQIYSKRNFKIDALGDNPKLLRTYVPTAARAGAAVSTQVVNPYTIWYNTTGGATGYPFIGFNSIVKNYGGLLSHPDTLLLPQQIKLLIVTDIALRG